ncbi:hypothetical protein HO173_001747 [Letharia columbiana]|uniref:Methyltransferase type 11 domain-containing protein n=1 Tax=Letharia columbiana TaxID=112416 RepID=A0A8H6G415_9LECA|nr:uncharacterized protein HO173_001747 [Letharia columbiana]KAF6240137.1 hypothetical protein HO173_001747 [Letharia columbiana]
MTALQVPQPDKERPSKDVAWYNPDVESNIRPEMRDLLLNYSKIPAEDLVGHITKVRDAAWDICPYPTVGLLLFLDFGIKCTDLPEPRAQLHTSILHTLMQGGKLLDVGCMFGQDLRKMVYEGAPVSSVYGTDLRGDYFPLGYALFKDETIIPQDHFIAADIMDQASPLCRFDGDLDVISTKDVFHCFDYATQIELAMRFVALLKPRPGSRAVGQHVGHISAGVYPTAFKDAGLANMFLHNDESFTRMWEEVGKKTGSRWRVESRMWKIKPHWEPVQVPGQPRGPDNRTLLFAVERL